jgi:hypothetical protein
MRQYKTVAQIFLILSVVNFTFAGLAQSRAMQEAVVHSVNGGGHDEGPGEVA